MPAGWCIVRTIGAPARPRGLDDAILACTVVALFGHTARYGLLARDDLLLMRVLPLVAHPLALGWRALLVAPPAAYGYPMPLTIALQHVELMAGPWLCHATNVALHALAAMLVRRLALSFGASRGSSLLGALAFAVHPLVVEPVAWATGQRDLLSFVCVCGAYLVFRRAHGRPGASQASAIVLLFALGLGAKPSAVALPALLAADALVARRAPTRAGAVTMATTALAAAAWALLAARTQQHNHVLAHTTAMGCALYPLQHLAFELRSFVLPTGLAARYYDALPRPIASGWGIAGIEVGVAAVAALVIALRRGAEDLATALAFACITFAPSGVVQLVRGPADAYMYAPLAGIAVAIALLLDRAGARGRVARIATLGATAVWATFSFLQSLTWASDVTLWERVVAVSPDEPDARARLFDAHLEARDPGGAIGVARAAVDHFHGEIPGRELALDVAFSHVLAQDYVEAAGAYDRLFTRQPDDPGLALRLLSSVLLVRAPSSAPASDVERASAVVRAALVDVDRTAPDARAAALASFARATLFPDDFGVPALRALERDPEVGGVARDLIAARQTEAPRISAEIGAPD